jgi:predicted ATPase/DNA-binding CsgD family transcriptional regulator
LTVLGWPPNVIALPNPAPRPAVELAYKASRFIGRRRQIAQVEALLRRERLVTLTGAAGSGKTRLALEVASRAAATRRDAAFLIELASLNEGSLLPQVFATALDVKEVRGRPLIDIVIERLTAFEGLLLVDNCEHLIEACAALIDAIIRRCRRLTVLATSREPLHIDAEVVWSVPPLSLPAETASMAEVAGAEAVELFVARARQVRPGFELNTTNAKQVSAICRRLDGLPLALELAASRTAALDLASIVEQLDNRFLFLTRGYRNAPPRQRTLRAAIDWSYDLLTTAESQLLSRASVFAGSFDLPAAEAICSGGAVLKEQVVELLSRLADKSLVTPLDHESGRRRYRLLESLRAYGADRLHESNGYAAVRRNHAGYYTGVTAEGFGTTDPTWLPRVRLELDNVRDALAWSRATDPDLHLHLSLQFGHFCMRAGQMAEGRAWLEASVASVPASTEEIVRAYEMLAMLAWRQGAFDDAERFATKALDVARSHDDDRAIARALGAFCFVLIGALRFEPIPEAIAALKAIAKRVRSRRLEADALFYQGLLEAHGEDVEKACNLIAQSLAIYEADGASDEVATQHNALAWTLLRRRDLAQARAEIAKAIAIRLRLNEVADLGSSLEASAELAFGEGEPERAIRLIGAADALREKWGSAPPSLAVASRERWMPLAEKLLGKQARALWFEGRKLSLEEATRYATAPASEPPPRSAKVSAVGLSDRELEIAGMVADGLTNDQIARRLAISKRTVDAHLDHIRTKLGFRSRVEVAMWTAASRSGVEIS